LELNHETLVATCAELRSRLSELDRERAASIEHISRDDKAKKATIEELTTRNARQLHERDELTMEHKSAIDALVATQQQISDEYEKKIYTLQAKYDSLAKFKAEKVKKTKTKQNKQP
jgi:hypothetical protein